MQVTYSRLHTEPLFNLKVRSPFCSCIIDINLYVQAIIRHIVAYVFLQMRVTRNKGVNPRVFPTNCPKYLCQTAIVPVFHNMQLSYWNTSDYIAEVSLHTRTDHEGVASFLKRFYFFNNRLVRKDILSCKLH